ncbi:hypothetical protein BHE74_00036583 [Ensete ventricosum]|nr:hypothetical protein GW17_00029125 [Ensete ventricosum]RWW56676.1 hypothetical protein BHE74_00036583 [Ensete ventricosum]
MEASAALSLQSCSWIGSEKVGRKTSGFARLSNRCLEERKVAMVRFGDPLRSGASISTGHAERKIFCCHKKPSDLSGGTGSENFHSSFDEALVLKSEVLKDLSSMRRLVVATGGGAVIRPINWKYMKQGITIWLDVPLEALARRIAAVGTASRPLLHQEPGDPYTKAYANADARVSLEYIADKKGHGDVHALTPTDIAFEV